MRVAVFRKLRQIVKDTSGSVTVEFVFWFPVLMFWLIGTIVFFDAFKSRSNLNAANSTVADIISRNSEVSAGYINQLSNMQTALLPRTDGNGLRISLIQFTQDVSDPSDPGEYEVEWSAVAGAAVEVMEDEDINVDVLPNMYPGESILFVESSVPYQPLTTFIGVSLITLRSEVAISPRYESRVAWVP